MRSSTIAARVFKQSHACAAMVLMLTLTACSSGVGGSSKSDGIKVPLLYRPTNLAEGSLKVPAGKPKVFIAPVEDARSRTTTIGENREDSPPIPVRVGSGTPSQFVQSALREELRRHGVNVVDNAAGADRTLAISISTFEANEAPNYHGQILLMVKVMDASGKVLSESSASGENSTWGKSADPANYQQVLSNSMVDLYSKLMGNADFINALSMTAANPA